MLSYEFLSHLVPSIIYLLIISLLKIGHFTLTDYLLFWLGGLIGTYLLDIDHFLYCLITKPDKPCSLKAQEFLKKKDYRNFFWLVVNSHYEHQELTFHSALFLPIWIVFCFFILTSSGSLFASSLVMTIYLHLLKDIWDIVRLEKSYQLNFLFWQIKPPAEEKIKKYYVWTVTAAFLLITLYLLR